MKKNYIVEVFCRNCDYGCSSWHDEKKLMKIPLGTKVDKMKCPKCKCKTIEARR